MHVAENLRRLMHPVHLSVRGIEGDERVVAGGPVPGMVIFPAARYNRHGPPPTRSSQDLFTVRAFFRALVCAIVVLGSWPGSGAAAPQGIAELARDAARRRAAQQGRPTELREPEWIVADVVAAIEQMRMRAAGVRGDTPAVHVVTAGYTPHARFDVEIAPRSSRNGGRTLRTGRRG